MVLLRHALRLKRKHFCMNNEEDEEAVYNARIYINKT